MCTKQLSEFWLILFAFFILHIVLPVVGGCILCCIVT